MPKYNLYLYYPIYPIYPIYTRYPVYTKMSILHLGFVVLKYTAKPLAEIALERYARHLVKTSKGYLAYQINLLCEQGKEVPDSYAARMHGYYTLEEVIKKLHEAQSDHAKKIVDYTISLHEDDGFVFIEEYEVDELSKSGNVKID